MIAIVLLKASEKYEIFLACKMRAQDTGLTLKYVQKMMN